MIDYDGTRYIFAKDTERTWHAGESKFKALKWLNNHFIGVEFLGDTNIYPLRKKQIESFVEWVKPKMQKYHFQIDMITDHRTVSPGRKVDVNCNELIKIITQLSLSLKK